MTNKSWDKLLFLLKSKRKEGPPTTENLRSHVPKYIMPGSFLTPKQVRSKLRDDTRKVRKLTGGLRKSILIANQQARKASSAFGLSFDSTNAKALDYSTKIRGIIPDLNSVIKISRGIISTNESSDTPGDSSSNATASAPSLARRVLSLNRGLSLNIWTKPDPRPAAVKDAEYQAWDAEYFRRTSSDAISWTRDWFWSRLNPDRFHSREFMKTIDDKPITKIEELPLYTPAKVSFSPSSYRELYELLDVLPLGNQAETVRQYISSYEDILPINETVKFLNEDLNEIFQAHNNFVIVPSMEVESNPFLD